MPSFINKQTTLDLNGPILSFTTHPSSVSACTSGIATFVGIATATFPIQDPQNPATGTGYISYRWYWEGYGELSDGNLNGTTVAGSATTTLTLSGISSSVLFNNSKFFLRADYVPSAYVVSGSDVTAGTARSTGNAINDPTDSNTAVLTVYPEISIVSQITPGISTVSQGSVATFTVDANTSDPQQGNVIYQWQLNNIDLVDGINTIPGFTTSLSSNLDTEVFGSKTSRLEISISSVGINTIRAKISHPTACNSPIYSNTSNLNVVAPTDRAVIELESYQLNSTIASLREFDLKNLEYTITSNVIDSDTICFYAKDRDLVVEMDMYAAKGSDMGKYIGGEGGYSKIRFTMKRNEEFILKGIKTKTALYLYRKAQLIACVGQGGSAGSDGNGGRGGGVGVNGENGFGRFSGNGGPTIASGQLSGNGIFGSSSTATTIYSEDSRATGTNGGRTISCSKGVYWRQQGKTACQDLGSVKFRLSDGSEVTNSASISRGFKDGYIINQTAGISTSTGGNGGNGATGGSGGSSGGGGGGSGYTDTSATVVESTLGGNTTSQTKVVLRLYEVLQDFYIDDKGRILILSAATAGKDPRTLTKTTSRVLPGSDSCIDDVRWQNFLNLALTQDYRLTATLDGGKTSVTRATSFNIRRMLNSNYIKLKTSLTDWQYVPYSYTLYSLAWDENSIDPGVGLDYSILSWGGTRYYYGYYGHSTNSFFSPAYSYGNVTANWWILPPGVPDFS